MHLAKVFAPLSKLVSGSEFKNLREAKIFAPLSKLASGSSFI
jgi:hypothetical protein